MQNDGEFATESIRTLHGSPEGPVRETGTSSSQRWIRSKTTPVAKNRQHGSGRPNRNLRMSEMVVICRVVLCCNNHCRLSVVSATGKDGPPRGWLKHPQKPTEIFVGLLKGPVQPEEMPAFRRSCRLNGPWCALAVAQQEKKAIGLRRRSSAGDYPRRSSS